MGHISKKSYNNFTSYSIEAIDNLQKKYSISKKNFEENLDLVSFVYKSTVVIILTLRFRF